MMIKSKKNILFLLVAFGLLIALVILFWANVSAAKLKPLEHQIIRINNQSLNVELAQTSKARYQGLSGRDNLASDSGMLFYFPESEIVSFVMRDMKFSLDIVFIADDKIVKIAPNLIPEGSDYKNIYSSDTPVNYVLEIPGGYAASKNIKVGDYVFGIQD